MKRLELFSTPMLVSPQVVPPDLAHEWTARLIAESTAEPGVQRSNVGGWHSRPDLSTRPAAAALMRIIWTGVRDAVDTLGASRGKGIGQAFRFGIQAWGMVMRAGDYTLPHHHAAAHLAGVLYLDAGDADATRHPQSGRLSFVDPRASVASADGFDLFPSLFEMRPRTGSMVVFPGFVQHFVHPYRGTRPRVSVSFNVRLEPLVEGAPPTAGEQAGGPGARST